MRAKLNFRGKEIVIEPVKKVSEFGKYTGLMFSINPKALLFEFEKGRTAIHSFFCRPFLAIWLLDGKIVDYRLVNPFQVSVRPKADYNKLIEVPVSKRYEEIIDFILGGKDLNTSST